MKTSRPLRFCHVLTLLLSAVALLLGTLLQAQAQSPAQTAAPSAAAGNALIWPNKPVRLVVTFTAGGAADFTARGVADKLSDLWKQQVIVENRIGAGGNIGVESVFRAAPDGYTLLLASAANAFNMALNPKLPFDLYRDFAPLGLATSTPMAIAINPRRSERNLRELVSNMQAAPGRISYATCGVATMHHFAAELFKYQTKTFALHIPYRGCSAAVVDTVGGQIDVVVTSLNTVLSQAKAGKLRILGITSRNRSASAADVPTFREAGIPALRDYEADIYYGFMAPAATPREVLAKIEGDIKRVLAMPDLVQRFTGGGLEMLILGPNEMLSTMRGDAERFRKVIDYAGIKPE